jgi:hypothetical protein
MGWLAAVALAGVATGCGQGAAPDAAAPAGAGAAAAAVEQGGPQAPADPAGAPPAPAAARADAGDPLAWSRCSVAHGSLVVPSLRRLLARGKAIAKPAAPAEMHAGIDRMEQDLLQALKLPPAALEAIDQDRPIVLVLTTPDKKQKDAPLVGVVPTKDAAKLRAAITAPPVEEGVPPEMLAERSLKAVPGEDGTWRFTRRERRFEWEAYQAACEKARAAGQPEPDDAAFNREVDATVLILAERPGLVFLAAAEAPLTELLGATLPATVPAPPADDAVLWIAADKIRARFREDVDEFAAEMRKESKRETRGAPEFVGGVVSDTVGWIEQAVRQARDAEVRVGLDPVIRLSLGATFPAGESVGQALAEQLHDGPDLVGLLPADGQLVVSSRFRYTERMRDWGKRFFDGILAEARRELDQAQHKAMLDRWQGIFERQYAALTGESAAAMGLHRDQGLWMVQVARATDEAKARAAMRDLAAGFDDLVRTFMGEAPAEVREQVALEISHQADAGKHRDVPLDRVEVRLALGEKMPAAGAAQDAMRRLFGGPRLEAWYAVTKGHVVMTFGSGAEGRCTAVLDRLLDGKTEGPGGDWPKLRAAMGGAPTVAVYLAPLALADEGFNLGVAVQASACLRHQPQVEHAATAYHTVNGAWPRDVGVLYQQELLSPAGDVGCAMRYQIDPNTGRVRCRIHGTVDAPVAAPSVGEAFDVPWDRPAGAGGFAYWGNVTRQGDVVGVEIGAAMPADGPGHFAKALAPVIEAMGGGARRRGPDGPAGFAPAESRAVAMLRHISMAQAQFQSQAHVDQDADGVGEFGFLGEMAGTEAPRGAAAPLEMPLLPPIFGQKNGQGVSVLHGYCYKLYLPSGPKDDKLADPATAIGELGGGAAAPSDKRHADPQEVRWICYAWPVQRGASGMRTFVVNQAGDVYATEGLMAPYSGADAPPPAHAAMDADGGDPANLDAGVGLAAAGLRATDGNTWVPVG